MQMKTRDDPTSIGLWARLRARPVLLRRTAMVASIAIVLFLALYNLTDYPLTWFDEGSHLHVPKTLIRFGVYADYSSEGFRHYGPTIGVGPTVMLPIAATFWAFGVGLLQARLVMALYLLATVYAFYRLAQLIGGRDLAWVATALLVASRSAGLLLYGRQVLGEVPGFLFLVTGLFLWFRTWERSTWLRLVAVGLLLGLSMITKYQYLLFLAPALLLGWVLNIVYYRTAPHRAFLVPGAVAACCFALWQVYLVLYLGPSTAAENLAVLRRQSAGAAMVFSPRLIEQSLNMLVSISAYLGALLPALGYGLLLALPRRRASHQWAIIWLLASLNLVWYVVASVGWWRYAFLGLALASLFIARLFADLAGAFRLRWPKTLLEVSSPGTVRRRMVGLAMSGWLAAMILIPLGQTVYELVRPEFNAPMAMAHYMDEHVSSDALVESWEPEMGFLTNHNYHFPPAPLLTDAVSQVSLGGPPVATLYDFVQTQAPEYVLQGPFARGVGLYPAELLKQDYRLVTQIGAYDLYQRSK